MTGRRDALDPAERRVAVRRWYAALATGGPCCEDSSRDASATDPRDLGYSPADLDAAGSVDASLGCGNPTGVADLSSEKHRVFEKAHRVLRPGGRLVVSDVVLTAELPADLRTDPESVAACVGGAASVPELESMLTAAGFVDVSVEPKTKAVSSSTSRTPTAT